MKFVFKPLLFLLTVLLFSCSSPSEDSSKAVFRYNEPQGISSLDPAFSRSFPNVWAVSQLFNGLVDTDDSLHIVPSLAKRWEIKDEGKTYLFTLRNDVHFHDHPQFQNGKGRKVTASDFEYSFKRLLSDETASPGSWVLQGVDSLKPFESLDDTTFIIHLKSASPSFLSLLTTKYCSVVPKEICEYYGKDFRNNPVGTGPFKFSLWKEGVKLILLKNDNYFETDNGKRLPYLDAVTVSFINDRQTAFMEFVQGKFDMLNSLDVSYKDELLTQNGDLQNKYIKKFKIETGPFLNTEYLGFLVDEKLDKVKQSPVRFKKVRQAISYGFDRKRMIRFLRNNMGYPGVNGFVPPTLYGDSNIVSGYEYDPVKAKQLLTEAGFPGGKGLPEIVLSTVPNYADLCEYIQRELLSIGIKIKVEINQGATHRELVSKQGLVFFRGSWIADYPDAENYFVPFYSHNFSPGGPNTTRFKSAEFDKLYENLNSIKGGSVKSTYCRMDSLIMNECPIIVLYYDRFLKLYQNNISGFATNALNDLDLKRVKKVGSVN